jgi:hypothetical protein
MIKRTYGFLRTWKMALLTGGLTLGVALSPYMAQAQDAPGFSDVDQNVDGVVSEDEFLMAMPEATAETFASADVNGDTVLTQDEYEAMAAMME